MFEVSTTFYVVLVLYFAVILGIGIWSGTKNKGTEDFLVAGRSIGPLVGGAAFAATQMSAGTFVGTLGIHYLTGGSFLWIWAGLWFGWLIAATLVGPKFQSFKGLTVPDYVGTRFNSKAARGISALLILVAYTVYLTAQYQAGGNIFQTLFGIPFIWGAIITVGITLLYTMIGGMRATAYSDFVQAIIMAGCFFAALPLLFNQAGGTEFVGNFLAEFSPNMLSWHFGFKELLGFGAAFGFAMAAAPYELARMYTLRDRKTVKLAIGFSFVFQAVVGISVAAAGMAIRALFPYMPTPDIASTIMAINILPPVVGSLIILAILSAIMSTVSGIMMVSASAFSHDFYATMIKPNASDSEKMKVNRIAVLVLGIIPIFLALRQLDIVQFIVVLQASLTASFFFATVILGLNWKRGTAAGAIVSMIGGFFTALFWYLAGNPLGINEVIPGVMVSFVSFIVVSLVTKPVPKEALQPFFEDVK
ncbi:sodium:solute symporter [Neobacillus sp. NPDC097160]|uniref:sodium:solute symporter family protein n=1 Tax=Neobacillus sp. NPDC097160 TaxID=3364298 RepID=UPI0038146972